MKPLRLAVIGAGRLGTFHARLATGHDHVELSAIVDPLAPARDALAAELNTTAVERIEDVLDDIDAAIIAAPTTLHYAIARALLERGVHLLIEKPITVEVDEADALVSLARSHGCVLQVGHVERFNPALDAALPLLSEPKFIQASRLTGFTCRSTDVGVVLDLMIHDIDIALQAARSKVVDVEALGISLLSQHEDVAHARLRFANGCLAELTASRASFESRRTMQVWTAAAFTEVDFATNSAKVVQPSEQLMCGELDVEELAPDEKQHLTEHLFDDYLPTRTLERQPINALLEEQRDFVESIRTGRQPRVTGEHGRDALAVAHQILTAITAHSWDGTADGPQGPHGKTREPILRGPHWHLKPATKRAG